MNNRIPVENLSYGVLDMKPIDTEWNPEEYVDDQWRFWESFDFEVDGHDEPFVLIASHSSVVAIFTPDGVRIDPDDIEECQNCDGSGEIEMTPIDGAEGLADAPMTDCPECNGTGNECKLTADQIEELRNVEPYMHGAEGPMMNYRYPTGDSSDSIGGYRNSGDAIGIAYRLRHVPLCVVEYDDDIALALTGGGMDLSWQIVEAFTLLGYLPPVHFDLPGMSGRGTDERDRYLIAAMDRSLTSMVERMQRQLDQHREKWSNK